jgi:hypothetical protein
VIIIKHRLSGNVILEIETLSDANLSWADLSWADLSWADLRGADLRGADLRDADLRGADLRGADLRGTDLSWADLRGTNLDFYSGFSFKCASFNVKIDLRIAAQLAYHFCKMDCSDPKFIAAKESLKELANKFHRVDECGKIE